MRTRLLVAAGLACILRAAAAQSVGCSMDDGACLCSDGETVWDLTELSGDIGPIEGPCSNIFCSGNWEYHFNLCENLNVITGIGCSSLVNTAAQRIDTFATCPPSTSCECEIMGPDNAGAAGVAVSAIEGDETGVLVNFVFNTRSLALSIVCDNSAGADSLPEDVPEVATAVTMTWRTPAICPGGANIGWLFVIFTGVAAGLYVGGGVGYASHTSENFQRGNVEALVPRTWEAHPHLDMWNQIPDLVRDGVTFTKATIMGDKSGTLQNLNSSERGSGYEGLDEAAEKSSLIAEGGGKGAGGRPQRKKGVGNSPRNKPDLEEGEDPAGKKKKQKKKKKPKPTAAAKDGGAPLE